MRKRLGVFVVGLCLVVPRALAFPIFGDPDVIYLLRVVSNLLRTIQQVELEIQRGLQRRIETVVTDVAFPSYPGSSVFDPIREAVTRVRGIRQELMDLSCGREFSGRMSLLHERLLRPLRLCRPEFQLVWGSPEGHWDEDFLEVQDFASTLSSNVVSARVEAEESWTGLFPAMGESSGLLRRSPGEASRDEAVLLAATGHVAASNASIASQKLLVESLDWEGERSDERLRTRASLGLLQGIACLGPGVCRDGR